MTLVGIASTYGALVTTGVMAGIYVAFSIAVMPGLAATDDSTYVAAMRSINVSILNPVFAVFFAGPLVLLVLAVLGHLGREQRTTLAWLGAALVLFVVTLVVTGIANVPLNDQLAAATSSAAEARVAFHDAWVRWNVVRCVAAVGSFVALVGAVRA